MCDTIFRWWLSRGSGLERFEVSAMEYGDNLAALMLWGEWQLWCCLLANVTKNEPEWCGVAVCRIDIMFLCGKNLFINNLKSNTAGICCTRLLSSLVTQCFLFFKKLKQSDFFQKCKTTVLAGSCCGFDDLPCESMSLRTIALVAYGTSKKVLNLKLWLRRNYAPVGLRDNHSHVDTAKMDHMLANLLSKVHAHSATSFIASHPAPRTESGHWSLPARCFTYVYSSLIAILLALRIWWQGYKMYWVSLTHLQNQNCVPYRLENKK